MKREKNPLWFFSRAEVEFFEKPFYTGHRWIGFNDDNMRVLLTRSRCKELGYPVHENEEATAYRYTINGSADRKYVPVYDRTNCDLPLEKLYSKEVYPKKSNRK